MAAEEFEFQAETKQLLDLMIHSLYSNRDVFLRELISNASDALDRLRFAGLTDAKMLPEEPLRVNLQIDKEARVLSIDDNGIGMSRDEVVANIGTIAKSGTSEFLSVLEKNASAGAKAEITSELIGQFGVGFYASFMAADEVSVITRKAGEAHGTRWVSEGAGNFSVEQAERETAGTTVLLRLKSCEGADGIADYTDRWLIQQIVRKYSDFVAYPIHLEIIGGDDETGTAASDPAEPLNTMKAIWIRPADEVEEDEYREFYKHISHDWNDPLLHLASRIEGNFEARALLYVPSVAPF
ncbi:MAG: ATP-binding protein, partial [Myxococcota bacterium]